MSKIGSVVGSSKTNITRAINNNRGTNPVPVTLGDNATAPSAADTISLALGIADNGGQVYKAYIKLAYEWGAKYEVSISGTASKPDAAIFVLKAANAGIAVEGHFSHFSLKNPHDNSHVFTVGKKAVVWLILDGQQWGFTASGTDLDLLKALGKAASEAFPEPVYTTPDPRIAMAFWMLDGQGGGSAMTRTLEVLKWSDAKPNYTKKVAAGIQAMVDFRPSSSGQLFLWHGPPGTGKTYALRALAWEWRYWCDIYYITDPNSLLNGPTQYMNDVLLDDDHTGMIGPWVRNEPQGPDTPGIIMGDDRWRLLILEDSGELMTVTARQEAGPGLGRLLNMVDGLLGQGLKFLVLLTTNEPMKKLHPAVIRPGRCAARVEFSGLTDEEIKNFLIRHKLEGIEPPKAGTTIADLYALKGGQVVVEKEEERMGF